MRTGLSDVVTRHGVVVPDSRSVTLTSAGHPPRDGAVARGSTDFRKVMSISSTRPAVTTPPAAGLALGALAEESCNQACA